MQMNDSEKREVEQFKRELDSIGYYCSKLQDVNVELFAIAVQLYEVSGTRYDNDPSVSANPNRTPKMHLMMKEEELISEASKWESKINYCRKVLNKCTHETKMILVDRHIRREGWFKIESKHFLTRNAIKYNVDKELSKVLTLPLAIK